jgi:hypothetical protein
MRRTPHPTPEMPPLSSLVGGPSSDSRSSRRGRGLEGQDAEFDPVQVEAIYQAGDPRPTSYGFEGKDTAGKAIKVYISADGKTFPN